MRVTPLESWIMQKIGIKELSEKALEIQSHKEKQYILQKIFNKY